MASTSIVHPMHYLIVFHSETTWYFKPGSGVFYNHKNVPVSLDIEERCARFGLTPAAIMIEFFRLNGGKNGYYLANLKSQKYYYCGPAWSDVKFQLQNLGRRSPYWYKDLQNHNKLYTLRSK